MVLRLPLFALLAGLLVLSGGTSGQEKKDDPKKDVKKDDTTKKDEPKAKGMLPMNWGKIGLDDKQKQEIYKVQGKYNEEIDKLEAKIKEIKLTRDKEMKAVLSPEQKKKLDDILLGKDK